MKDQQQNIKMLFFYTINLFSKWLADLNTVFSSIFILEAIIKVTTLSIREYFYNNWNKFDLLVVATSIVDIVLYSCGQS